MNVKKILVAAVLILSSVSALECRKCKPVATIGLNFTAAIQNQRWQVLPNDTGAVGKKQYAMASYMNVKTFDKQTGRPDGVLDVDSGAFFNHTTEDIRIRFNFFAHRWIVSCEDLAPYAEGEAAPYDILLAVSDGDPITPCTKWPVTTLPFATINPTSNPFGYTDYHVLGFDENNTYISVQCLNENGIYSGSAIVINTASLLAGSPILKVFPGLGFVNSTFQNTLDTPINFDPDPEFGYFLLTNFVEPDFITGTSISLWRIENARSTNWSIFPANVDGIQINVPQFANNDKGIPFKKNLYGLNGGLQPDIFGTLVQSHVRNKQLYTSHTVLVDSSGFSSSNGDRFGTRWYQFDLTGDPTGQGKGNEQANTTPALVQWGTLYDSDPLTPTPRSFWNGTLITNKYEQLALAVATAGANDYPNIAYTGRLKKDPAGTLREPVLVTHTTFGVNLDPFNPIPLPVTPVNSGSWQRWGDASSMMIDPCNQTDFWATNIFAGENNGYAIQATQLIPRSHK